MVVYVNTSGEFQSSLNDIKDLRARTANDAFYRNFQVSEDETENRLVTSPKADDNEGTSGPPKRRILVVDDNRDAAESLAILLRMLGHDVRTVYDGPQAIAQAEIYRPDLLLLDIGLPGMDGYEVARRLRLEPRASGAKLVALTGYAREEDRRRAQAAGFDYHLVKPVAFESLKKLLAGLDPTAD
jgi:two-component system, sensor histidine kinase